MEPIFLMVGNLLSEEIGLNHMGLRLLAAVLADFPVIAAADPLGGAAISQTAVLCADNQES
jgi:hypothetical protein